jgi:lysophospholipase L1-like esterase
MIAENLSNENEKIVNVIDIFNTMGGASLTEPQWFMDFCHPNDQGYKAMA